MAPTDVGILRVIGQLAESLCEPPREALELRVVLLVRKALREAQQVRGIEHLCRGPVGRIARELLGAIWHVLSERAADCHAEPAMVAYKLMRWSWRLTDEQRGGLTSRRFIRYGLLHLKLGHDLSSLTYGGKPRRLASVEEILTLFPELASPA